ncbi:subtype B tannase [Spirosoma validum]|uniref:Tat pathway signal sequence domain protein n=1 Tax=Spirosoma validum TaxID=2771355 RepID=A0A927AZV3_9BACT|nr:subtype B tannase [Spirosoma validum]MBD2752914.1 Tat pathway signal sequence domain protein [Spirosoma validum]
MFKPIKALTITFVSVLTGQIALAQSSDPLLFPKNAFTVETKTVKTLGGEKTVTYRSYMHIPYVANPVDKEYQSLNVSVPVKVNNADIDAINAPILFVIGVGGYMSVNNVRGRSFGPGGGPGGNMGNGPGGPGGGNRPSGQPGGPGGLPPMGMGGPGGNANKTSGKADLALAAGYVVVSPGCRGRDNQAADGTYYGKAPAVIVDLKAAVRYVRHNKGVIPGNVDWIVSTGVSAGGAMSALLGASGNSPLYEPYLKEIGAADAPDNIFAIASFCPIADLEHADGAYEWMYGTSPLKSGLVDQDLSSQLKALNAPYQASLKLKGKNGFGTLTADNYDQYLTTYYLIPSATTYLNGLTDEKRKEYLDKNTWMTWNVKSASFSFADYVTHVGRMKGLPAFDDFDKKQPEPSEFGNKTINSRHFTQFSLQHNDKNATLDEDVKKLVNLMNPMYFIGQKNKGSAQHWWFRQGSSDAHTSQTVMANLATSLENQNKNVSALLYWDAGHGADNDPEDFVAWMGKITGASKPANVRK